LLFLFSLKFSQKTQRWNGFVKRKEEKFNLLPHQHSTAEFSLADNSSMGYVEGFTTKIGKTFLLNIEHFFDFDKINH